jgi:hypothetical protein
VRGTMFSLYSVSAEPNSAYTEYKPNIVPCALSISLTEFDFVCENGWKNNSGAFKEKISKNYFPKV